MSCTFIHTIQIIKTPYKLGRFYYSYLIDGPARESHVTKRFNDPLRNVSISKKVCIKDYIS
jgi:hypothetical protein